MEGATGSAAAGEVEQAGGAERQDSIMKLGESLENQLWNQLWNQLGDQLGDQLRDQLSNQLKETE